jgi:hypothetical protein
MVPTMNSFGRSAHPIAHSLSVLLLSLMLSDWCLKATRRECPIVRNPGDEHALRKTALVTGASRGISRRGGVHRRSGVLIHYRVESYRCWRNECLTVSVARGAQMINDNTSQGEEGVMANAVQKHSVSFELAQKMVDAAVAKAESLALART